MKHSGRGSAGVVVTPCRQRVRKGRVRIVWVVLLVLLAWNGMLWLVLGGLFAPLLPGGWRAVLGPALLLVLPVLSEVRPEFPSDTYPRCRPSASSSES